MRRKRSEVEAEVNRSVFGLDLSLVTPGVVELSGDLAIEHRVRSVLKDEARIDELVRGVSKMVGGLRRVVAVEDFAFSRANKAHEIGGLSYSVRVALAKLGHTVLVVPVSALKKFACGKGNAGKNEVAVGVFKRWGFEHRSDDVVDAYALARVAQLWALKGDSSFSIRERDVLKVVREVSLYGG